MPTMKDFEPLIGTWHGEGEVPAQPPMQVTSDATIERLGEFIVFRLAKKLDRARQRILQLREMRLNATGDVERLQVILGRQIPSAIRDPGNCERECRRGHDPQARVLEVEQIVRQAKHDGGSDRRGQYPECRGEALSPKEAAVEGGDFLG